MLCLLFCVVLTAFSASNTPEYEFCSYLTENEQITLHHCLRDEGGVHEAMLQSKTLRECIGFYCDKAFRRLNANVGEQIALKIFEKDAEHILYVCTGKKTLEITSNFSQILDISEQIIPKVLEDDDTSHKAICGGVMPSPEIAAIIVAFFARYQRCISTSSERYAFLRRSSVTLRKIFATYSLLSNDYKGEWYPR